MKRVMKHLSGMFTSMTLVDSIVLLLLLSLTVGMIFYSMRENTVSIIHEDVRRLERIFKQIDADCGIAGFDAQKNPINFLNIKKGGFVGSEVGSMNLVHPKKWQGPYVDDNPTLQGKEYEIVATKNGYFIVPGDGVELPNGKIRGKDIIIDASTDLTELCSTSLRYQGKLLAAGPLYFNQTQPAPRSAVQEELAYELATGV